MKKERFILSNPAFMSPPHSIFLVMLTLVLGLAFVGCNNGGGGIPEIAVYIGGSSDGTSYMLVITENTARYTAQTGDAYELTAGSKKSNGKVQSVLGGVLTLKPANSSTTFTATVSGNSITALNGTITYTDNTTASAPGTLTENITFLPTFS